MAIFLVGDHFPRPYDANFRGITNNPFWWQRPLGNCPAKFGFESHRSRGTGGARGSDGTCGTWVTRRVP